VQHSVDEHPFPAYAFAALGANPVLVNAQAYPNLTIKMLCLTRLKVPSKLSPARSDRRFPRK
jgi:hypothetical protein